MTEEEMKEVGPAVVSFSLRQLERKHVKPEPEVSQAGSESPAERKPKKKDPDPDPEPDEDDSSFDERFKDFEPALVKELKRGRQAVRELRTIKEEWAKVLPEVEEMRHERQSRIVREIESLADEVGKDYAHLIGTGDRRSLTGDQRVQWFSLVKVMDSLANVYPGLDRKALMKRALTVHFADHPRKSSPETKPSPAPKKTPLARPGSTTAASSDLSPEEAAYQRWKEAREAKGLAPLGVDR